MANWLSLNRDSNPPDSVPLSRCTTTLVTTFVLLLIVGTSTIFTNNEHDVGTHDTIPAPSPPSSSSHRRRLTGTAGVSWLMSFPNSGTTYTERLIEAITQYTVATNYGHEHVNSAGEPVHILSSVPVFEGGKNGPFRLSDLDVPEGGFILTKTHCGGYCFSECPPNWYILTPEQYLEECIRGARFEEREGGTSERFWVQYDPSFAKRAVHLFRDPFDNIVSRFHHEFKTHKNQKDEEWIALYPNGPDGFRAWCAASDERHKEREPVFFDSEMIQAFAGVPCHGEFFRYVQWHNNAFATTTGLDIPVHVVHYMDYGTDFADTVKGILEFIKLDWVGDAPPFKMLGYDEGYYTADERQKIVTFMKHVASERTWGDMSRYVDKYTTTTPNRSITTTLPATPSGLTTPSDTQSGLTTPSDTQSGLRLGAPINIPRTTTDSPQLFYNSHVVTEQQINVEATSGSYEPNGQKSEDIKVGTTFGSYEPNEQKNEEIKVGTTSGSFEPNEQKSEDIKVEATSRSYEPNEQKSEDIKVGTTFGSYEPEEPKSEQVKLEETSESYSIMQEGQEKIAAAYDRAASVPFPTSKISSRDN